MSSSSWQPDPIQTNEMTAERRVWVRFSVDVDAKLADGAMQDSGWPAIVRNISLGGLGLLLKHRFKPGSFLSIELKNKDATFKKVLPVRVVHATAVNIEGDQWWLVGCVFVKNLRDEDLSRFT